MARIVCVHGIGKQLLGEQSLLRDWWPALADGLTRADADLVSAGDVAMAFYGDLFRPQGELLAVGDPIYGVTHVEPGLEQALLLAWWHEAAAVDDRVAPPRTETPWHGFRGRCRLVCASCLGRGSSLVSRCARWCLI